METKFQMKPAWNGEMKIYLYKPDNMTKMAIMSIVGKNLKKYSSKTKRLMTLKLGMQHQVLKYYQMGSNVPY